MESTQNKTRCPHSKKCGGCQLQNLDYKEQLAHKERTCIRLLGKFCRVEPIIGMENPYHYRNKVQAAFGTTRAGRIISGIYQSSTHNIVAVDSCMTEDEIADRIAMCSSSAASRPAKSWLCSSPVRRSSPHATISPVRC